MRNNLQVQLYSIVKNSHFPLLKFLEHVLLVILIVFYAQRKRKESLNVEKRYIFPQVVVLLLDKKYKAETRAHDSHVSSHNFCMVQERNNNLNTVRLQE